MVSYAVPQQYYATAYPYATYAYQAPALTYAYNTVAYHAPSPYYVPYSYFPYNTVVKAEEKKTEEVEME